MIMNPLAFLTGVIPWLEKILGSNTAKFAGNIYANYANSANRQTVGGNMEQQILIGKKYGIHPLEAIGGNVGSTPAIPMQNPLAGIQGKVEENNLDTKIKEESLNALLRESNDHRNKYSLMIPLSLTPDSKDGKKWWGVNSNYLGYNFLSTGLVYAANGEEALKLALEKISSNKEAEKSLREKIEANPPKEVLPGQSFQRWMKKYFGNPKYRGK